MVRTMVNLPDELHRAIKHLAIERRTAIAKMVTEALQALYQEDIEDLEEVRKQLKEYLKHPEQAIPYSVYRAKRLKRKA